MKIKQDKNQNQKKYTRTIDNKKQQHQENHMQMKYLHT